MRCAVSSYMVLILFPRMKSGSRRLAVWIGTFRFCNPLVPPALKIYTISLNLVSRKWWDVAHWKAIKGGFRVLISVVSTFADISCPTRSPHLSVCDSPFFCGTTLKVWSTRSQDDVKDIKRDEIYGFPAEMLQRAVAEPQRLTGTMNTQTPNCAK